MKIKKTGGLEALTNFNLNFPLNLAALRQLRYGPNELAIVSKKTTALKPKGRYLGVKGLSHGGKSLMGTLS